MYIHWITDITFLAFEGGGGGHELSILGQILIFFKL